jgi:hypothetical protein
VVSLLGVTLELAFAPAPQHCDLKRARALRSNQADLASSTTNWPIAGVGRMMGNIKARKYTFFQ